MESKPEKQGLVDKLLHGDKSAEKQPVKPVEKAVEPKPKAKPVAKLEAKHRHKKFDKFKKGI